MRIALLAVVAIAAGCSGGGTLPTGPSPVSTRVELHAVLSPGAAAATTLDCAGGIHLQPSWWGFAQVSLAPIEPGTWAVLFEDVPIGRHTVRIDAPEGCGVAAVVANGTRLADRDGTGALGFLVHADGSVSP